MPLLRPSFRKSSRQNIRLGNIDTARLSRMAIQRFVGVLRPELATVAQLLPPASIHRMITNVNRAARDAKQSLTLEADERKGAGDFIWDESRQSKEETPTAEDLDFVIPDDLEALGMENYIGTDNEGENEDRDEGEGGEMEEETLKVENQKSREEKKRQSHHTAQ